MQERILQYINQNQMVEKGDYIVVGVSGGADSVCLFHILRKLSEQGVCKVTVIHINHGLRGDNADMDEQFTKSLCQQYNIPYKSIFIDLNKEVVKRGMSLEEAGRMVRREAFEQFATIYGANKIALGHHQNDQAETVIFNLVRGSGITGLCGMHPVRGKYIRPLLCVSKEEIENHLTSHGLKWRVDETNLTEDYTRNKIRHKVIRHLEEINPKAGEHIATTAQHFQEVESYLLRQTQNSYDYHTKLMMEGVFFDEAMLDEDIVIQKRMMREGVRTLAGSLKDLNKNNIENMTTIFKKEVGKRIEIGKGFVIKRTYDGAVLERAKLCDDQGKDAVLVSIPGEWRWEQERFTFQIIKAKEEVVTEEKYTKWLDYDKVKGDLQLRNRQSGDTIVTCQNGGKKKLKDYFIDAKIPKEKRDELIVLACENEVLWIVGDRISEKYKVSKDTKQILKINKERED